VPLTSSYVGAAICSMSQCRISTWSRLFCKRTLHQHMGSFAKDTWQRKTWMPPNSCAYAERVCTKFKPCVSRWTDHCNRDLHMKSNTGGNNGERVSIFVLCLEHMWLFGRDVSVCVLCFGHMRLFGRLFSRNVERCFRRVLSFRAIADNTSNLLDVY